VGRAGALRVGVGAPVVGATVGVAVVGAAVGVGLGVALGASVVGAAVRIWIVMVGDADTDALGDGEADAPAKRERPPVNMTPISSSVTRPPATAARIRSIHRGPCRGGGMIFVVSDMSVRPAGCVPSGLTLNRHEAVVGGGPDLGGGVRRSAAVRRDRLRSLRRAAGHIRRGRTRVLLECLYQWKRGTLEPAQLHDRG